MTLEAAIFHPHDVHTYGCKDLGSLAAVTTSDIRVLQDDRGEFLLEEAKNEDLSFDCNHQLKVVCTDFGHDNFCGNSWESSSLHMLENIKWEMDSSLNIACAQKSFLPDKLSLSSVPAKGKRKRRAKSFKNKEEMENQRMTHIAVERNRRKQMNEYLAVLRSLMPTSYVQKCDQASIVGGAINFVKELEQQLHSLEARKKISQQQNQTHCFSPLADSFTFPHDLTSNSDSTRPNGSVSVYRSSMADIEATMFESHANLKVLTKKKPKQLLQMMSGLQALHLNVLHLNVTTIDEVVLYSFSLKVEDNCGISSVDKIVEAIYQIIERIGCEKDGDERS